MTKLEFLARLIPACMPLTIGIAVFITLNIVTKKHHESIAADLLSGLRAPTDDEAERIMTQLKPKVIRKIIVTSCVFLPFIGLLCGVIITKFNSEERILMYVMCVMAGVIFLAYIAVLSMPLSELRELKKRTYAVTDCTVAEINIYTRFFPRATIPVDIHRATVMDQIGYTWQTDLTKDIEGYVHVGTNCLVIIYAAEEKANRNRKSGQYLYRRALYVEK